MLARSIGATVGRAVLMSVLALGGCQPATASVEPSRASFRPSTVLVLHHTLTPEEGVPTGITEGRWTDDGGCLGLDGEAIDYIVLLPAGWIATDAGVLTADGLDAGRVGDLVRLGGGALGSPSEAARLSDAPIPLACEASEYWLVSELAPPESTYPVSPP